MRYKGQSAIEYLTTYGWMLLVVAIVGGAIFTTIQDSSQIQSTSGLANADAQIENFGVTGNGLEMEMRAASSGQLRNVNVSLIDPETGERVYASEEKTISVADTETVSLPNVGSSENTNTYDVEIQYDTGSLTDLETSGTVTGRISINGSIPSGNDSGGDGGVSEPTAAFSFNTSGVHPGETFSVDASNSTDNGSITGYDWDWTNDGVAEASGVTNTHSYVSTGTYTVDLTVADDQGNNDSVSQDLTVASNTAPAANFNINITDNVTTGETFSVDASGSSDTDGSISSYEWDWANDGSYDDVGQTNTYSYSSSGNKIINLRVTDDDGDVNTTSTEVEVVTTTQLIDGFEDGSVSEYSVDSSKTSGSLTATNSATYEGTYGAEIYTTGSVFTSGSTTGLSNYPSAGSTFNYSAYFPSPDNNVVYLYYGVQNTDNTNSKSYRITIRNQADSMELQERSGAGTIGSTSLNIPNNEWLKIEVQWGSSGSHTVTVYDSAGNELGSLSGSGSTYSSGGIGVGANNRDGASSTVYVDSIKVR